MTLDTDPAPTTRSRAANVALWTLQVLLALMFVLGTGVPKLLGDPFQVQTFAEVGVGQWLRYVVGVLEIAGGVGLLVPRLTGWAAAGLGLLMLGATGAQLFLLSGGTVLLPVAVGILALVVAWFRRPRHSS